MTEQTRLSRPAAAAAVRDIGWRYMVGAIATVIPVTSLKDAARVAVIAAETCGADADGHLRVDIRADRCLLQLQHIAEPEVTELDAKLAADITKALAQNGFHARQAAYQRSVQFVEVAIDAMDIPRVLPFWRAVLGYVDNPADDVSLIDPAGQGPPFWFQQMDQPRTQRNRFHIDVTVGEDEAESRLRQALAAGGSLLTDRYAKSFWVLADAEGNEVCICTWQDRD